MISEIRTLVFFTALVVGTLRVWFLLRGPLRNKHADQSFQAVSHILVGWLMCWWYLGGLDWTRERNLLLALTVIEVVCGVIVPLWRKHSA